MIHLIKKYYIFILVLVALTGMLAYQAITMLVTSYEDTYDPYYNPLAGGPVVVSLFMGDAFSTNRCDTVIQTKRGVTEGSEPDKSLRELFRGPAYTEYRTISSAFKGYDKIYNGLKIVNGSAIVDFKSDIIDPNSSFFKDFTKSCATSQLNQIVFTLKQFKEIQNVVIAIDGSPRKFMQTRQINCDLLENQIKFEKECLTKIP